MHMTAKTKNIERAHIIGALFIISAISTITALLLYGPVLNNPNYVIDAPSEQIYIALGALVEFVGIAAIVGSAIYFYPLLKKQNESLALAYVCGRVLEAAIISVGIISILTLLSLNDEFTASATLSGAYLATSEAILALREWTILFGANIILGANTFILTHILYNGNFIPRILAFIGQIAGLVMLLAALSVIFGIYDPLSYWVPVFSLPVFVFEVVLAAWLLLRGIND